VLEQVAVTVSEIVHVQDAEARFAADEGLAFDDDFKTFTDTTPEDLAALTEPARVRIGGVVNKLRSGKSQRGNDYASFTLAGPKGAFRVVVFQELAKAWAGKLKEGAALFVVGEAAKEDDGRVTVRADALVPAAGAREKFTKAVCLQLTVSQIHDEVLGTLSELALQHAGPTPLFFKVVGDDGVELELIEAAPDFRVKPTPDFIQGVKKLIPGSDVIVAAN
jgi:DNA polymerase-3 subunit alpha